MDGRKALAGGATLAADNHYDQENAHLLFFPYGENVKKKRIRRELPEKAENETSLEIGPQEAINLVTLPLVASTAVKKVVDLGRPSQDMQCFDGHLFMIPSLGCLGRLSLKLTISGISERSTGGPSRRTRQIARSVHRMPWYLWRGLHAVGVAIP
jgi:hypothetical protein